MSLSSEQRDFARCLSLLLMYAHTIPGYEITMGSGFRPDGKGHKRNSNHYIKLAQDLNLFIGGKYQRSTKAHEKLGTFWKSLDKRCRWGGDFSRKDGNHYSFIYRGRA